MAGSYLIPGALVHSREFCELSANGQRMLVSGMWCSPTRRSEGLNPLRIEYTMADLRMHEAEAIEAVREVQHAGFVDWDPEHEAILDLHASQPVAPRARPDDGRR
jgi:hypothetical protein